MTAGQIKAKLTAATMEGFDDLSPDQQNLLCISEVLLDAAEKTGGFQGWTKAYLDMCEATGRDPMSEPQKVLDYADIDRHCRYRLSKQVMEIELKAYTHRKQIEVARSV